mgnify:CR=1 FL=1
MTSPILSRLSIQKISTKKTRAKSAKLSREENFLHELKVRFVNFKFYVTRYLFFDMVFPWVVLTVHTIRNQNKESEEK